MAKKWKEILSDKGSFPDDFTVTLKNGETMTLGDMRSYDAEHEGELTKTLTAREQKLAEREGNLDTATKNMGQLLERVAGNVGLTVEELVQGKTPTKRAVAQATELDENDPLVGQVVKELRSLKAQNAELATKYDSLRKDALAPMLNTYLEDYYEGTWEKLSPTLPEGAEVTREQAMEYANKNGYKDQKGRLDLRKAIKDLTYDARVKVEAKKMASDLAKKAEDERILAAAPRPSSLGARVKPDKSLLNEKGQVKSLDEALNDAMADTDLWRQVQSVQ